MTEWFQNSIDDKAVDPRNFYPVLDASGMVQSSAGIRCNKCGGRNVQIIRNRNIGQQALIADGDVVKEIGWNPEDEWDLALRDVSYELL